MQYEYLCPFCQKVNIRYLACAQIVCDGCKKEFQCGYRTWRWVDPPYYPWYPYPYPDSTYPITTGGSTMVHVGGGEWADLKWFD